MCRACGSFYFFEYAPRFRDVFSKNDEIFALASFLLVLKSPVVQLSMINRDLPWVLAFPPPGSSRLSRGQLIYYITSASTCQGVLQNFLKKFFSLASSAGLLCPLAKLLDYTTFPLLCQGGPAKFLPV